MNEQNQKRRTGPNWIQHLVRGLFPKKLREVELKQAADEYIQAQVEYQQFSCIATEKKLNEADNKLHFAAMTLAGHIKPNKLFSNK